MDKLSINNKSLSHKAISSFIEQCNLSDYIVDTSKLLVLQKNNIVCIKYFPTDLEHFAEVFVYSNNVKAIHIRTDPISRGGIRISDRADIRNEAISLAYTQRLKNSCILPSGAKGCLIALTTHLEAYKDFVKGLLLDTDQNEYIAIGPDIGTADFSDIANSISKEYGYWLDDAFATSGTKGFNHKEMGITSAGVWRIIEQLIKDNNINAPYTVIGIGSMKGDVFGNAMLVKDIKLLAAISSEYIFLDPFPNIEESFNERKRLFESAQGWDKYNCLSNGGMIIKRSSKGVLCISKQVSDMLGSDTTCLTVQQIEKMVLSAKVDILFFAGKGIYINTINAQSINAKIIAEGANLAVTDNARVELRKKGVLVRGDFIDNAAGVICSDLEVNIKLISDKIEFNNALKKEAYSLIMEKIDQNYLAISDNTILDIELKIAQEKIKIKNILFKDTDFLNLIHNKLSNFLPESIHSYIKHINPKNQYLINGYILSCCINKLFSVLKYKALYLDIHKIKEHILKI